MLALIGWAIYTDKLASLTKEDVGNSNDSDLAHYAWEIFRGLYSTILSSPHACFYLASAEIFLSNLKESFKERPFATFGMILLILPTCLGLFNVELDIEESSHLLPVPTEGSPRGDVDAILAFIDAFIPNLNTMIDMVILKDKRAAEEKSLASNPYHQLVLKITNEELTIDEKQAKQEKKSMAADNTLTIVDIPSHSAKVQKQGTPSEADKPSTLIDIFSPNAKADQQSVSSIEPKLSPLDADIIEEKHVPHSRSITKEEKLVSLTVAMNALKVAESAFKTQGLFKHPRRTPQNNSLNEPLLAENNPSDERQPGCFDRIRSWCGRRASG